PHALAAPLDRDSLLAALQRPQTAVPLVGSPAAAQLPPELASQSLRPLSLPMVFSGFDPSTFEWARGVFAGLGFTPVMGAGSVGKPPVPLPDLQPGGAVGVSLVEGDMDLSVTGTITHIDGELAYVSLASVLQANERAFGTSTIQVDAKVTLSGGREVRVEDLFTQEQPAIQAAALVAAPVAYLMTNDFERVTVDKLDIDVSSL